MANDLSREVIRYIQATWIFPFSSVGMLMMSRPTTLANHSQKRRQIDSRAHLKQSVYRDMTPLIKTEDVEERTNSILKNINYDRWRIFKGKELPTSRPSLELFDIHRARPTAVATESSPSFTDDLSSVSDDGDEGGTSDPEASAPTTRSPTPEMVLPPTPPPRYRGFNGAPVSEHISKFHGNSLFTIKRKFEALPGSRVTMNMKRMPERRPIVWRNPDGYFNVKPINTTSQNNAIINYPRGREAAEPCTKCADGYGPFEQCIVGADRGNFQDGKGACASCLWANRAASCSLRPDYWATDTAYVDADAATQERRSRSFRQTDSELLNRHVLTAREPSQLPIPGPVYNESRRSLVSRPSGFSSIADHHYVKLSSSIDKQNPISMRLAMYEAKDTHAVLQENLPPLRR
ncbi:hypothetical protein FQN49_000789 [Arthroderma sp. PD_2]|nr:hypothetical protein FQN49_000789 [Arthroderma sp. PD_2]